MLEKKYSLNKKKDFDYVFQFGQSCYGRFLGIKAVANKLKYKRLGIMVSTKVSKKAPVRNKIKRQVRAVLKQFWPQLKNGFDVVIILLPPCIELDYQDIKKELDQQLQRLKLYV